MRRRKKPFLKAQKKRIQKGAEICFRQGFCRNASLKVQQFAGEFGEKIRVQILQAGIRNPMAPIFYMGAQAGLAYLACVDFYAHVMSSGEKEVDQAVRSFLFYWALSLQVSFCRVLLLKTQQTNASKILGHTFPDALDMMLICVQGGIGLEQTVERVAEEVSDHSPVLAEELGILSAEMAMLNDRRTALADFGRRVGGFGKSFATALIQAEQYGTSVSQALKCDVDRATRY